MNLINQLKRRGLIAQMTHESEISDLLDKEKITFYVGFDATADSLHIGHFLQLIVIKHFINAGHRPIALLGTGTTMIGDPTGKTDMRKIMSVDEINYNADQFKKQINRFIDIEDYGFYVRNGDWLLEKKYIEFLRDIGRYFSVNKMLTSECFKSRLEKGLNFIELNYMLLQSYDFLTLYSDYSCKLQLGGNDQWSNILSGIDLIRRNLQGDAYGITFTLLTTKDGTKMGKTEKGALWLDSKKTTPYEFFQYWRNISDGDVINCLKLLTFLPIEEIESYEHFEGTELNPIKELLAFEVTKLVHGEEESKKCLKTSKSIFGSGENDDNMPSTKFDEELFGLDGFGLLDTLVKIGLSSSKSEARRLIEQGGIYLNNEKITNSSFKINKESLKNGYFIIKKGKKIYHKIYI